MIHYLRPDDPFPPLHAIRDDMGGLLAIGGDLTPKRLLTAYRQGIFPWGTVEGHPLWYNPDPRMIMVPAEFAPSRSLRRTLRRAEYTIRINHDFAAVITACGATPRPGQDGTWITPEMRAAYLRLHELGWAHSVETWVEGELVGGLYGLAIGRMFYGESMFAHRTDASKIAFAHLCRRLHEQEFGMIDCQMHTRHLASLGAKEVPRPRFLHAVDALTAQGPAQALLATVDLRYDW